MKVRVPMGVFTENPLPVTVTLVPTIPCVGDRAIVAVVTVNGAKLMTAPPVYTITKYEPADVPDGTVTVVAAGIAPPELEVNVEPDPVTHDIVVELELRQML